MTQTLFSKTRNFILEGDSVCRLHDNDCLTAALPLYSKCGYHEAMDVHFIFFVL